MKKYYLCGVLASSIALTGTISAQETFSEPSFQDSNPAGAGISSYPAAYFTDQSLVTAFDLIGYVPGFTFQGGDNSRGLSGAAGNVLIDGRMPSAKSVGLQQLLRRLPASAVERIDIIRGGSPGINMQGQPVVANIIRREGASSAGSIEALTKMYPNGNPGRTLRGEQSRQASLLTLEGAFDVTQEQDQNKAGTGSSSRRNLADGTWARGDYIVDTWTDEVTASGTAAWDTDVGLFRLNTALGHTVNDESESTRNPERNGVLSDNRSARERIVSEIEIGGDYSRDFGQTDSVELVALQSIELEKDNASRGLQSGAQVATEEAREGETILRGIWRRQMSTSTNLETGLDGAFNFLDSTSELVRNGVLVELPSANVLVEELRSEVFTTLTTRPLDNLSLSFGLRAETSKITVSGGADAENRFTYLKPRFVAAYSAAGERQLRFGIEREVGQLDFDDFAAGSEFSSNTVNAGNPDLAPEEAWVLELGYEQPLFNEGAMALTLRHSEVDEVIDLIPISGFAAPGNIGSGNRQELVLSMTLPFDNIGPGLGRLQIDATWRDSEVTDPVTGDHRTISSEIPFESEINYTRDFPSLNGTFGVRGDFGTRQTAYRIDQIIDQRTTGYWRVYWDWRPRSDINVRAQVENLLSRDLQRDSSIYEDTRADSFPVAIEERNVAFDPFLMLRIRWNF